MLEKQVRYETGGLETILVVYENKPDRLPGLLSKKSVQAIIKLENEITSWDAPSESFANEKFKGTNVKWTHMCFAGEDAKIDERSRESACLSGGYSAYASPVTLFVDEWKKLLGIMDPEALDKINAGTLKEE